MKYILGLQKILIWTGVFLVIAIPVSSLFFKMPGALTSALFSTSFAAVFLVMIIRPLADILNDWMFLKKLIILRKGFGIFSASIIVGSMLSRVIAPESVYLTNLFSAHFFSFTNYAIFSNLGDVSGLILLLTSNQFSQKHLKKNWKRIQRLSYVYFYSGALYEGLFLESSFALYALMVVTNLVVIAWAIKIWRKGK